MMVKLMSRIERVVAYISLLTACLGLVEKIIHYVHRARDAYRKKRRYERFGFNPPVKRGRHRRARSK